jgi:hypothetical protein
MLPVLVLESGMYCCFHWRDFPPSPAFLEDDERERLRKEGELKPTEQQKYDVWKRICGKMKMDALCLECKMVRKLEYRNHLPVMVSMDGSQVIPITDITTFDAFPKNRGNVITGILGERRKK